MRLAAAILAALAVLVAALAFGAAVGETAIPLPTVAKVVANRLFGAAFPLDAIDAGIVWEYRLARAAVAACCGMALALSGVVLQALLRNALADPYVLGISAGASTGAVAVAILGLGAGILSLSAGAFLAIAPGDTVKFVAAQSGHNAASIEGMAPAGFTGFKGNINQEIEVTLSEPGVYGVKCSPHYAMGMVMLIAVGEADPSAVTIPDAVPKRAKDRLGDILARAPAGTR